MKVGINLLLWTGNPTKEHLPLIEQIARWGYDGVEVPIFHYDESTYKAFKERMDDLGLGATAITVMPPEANPISEDASVRAKAVEHLKRSLDMAAILGADVFAGPLYSPVGRMVGRPRNDDEWKWAIEVLREACEHAHGLSMDVAIEALNRFETYFINTLADACALARDVDHPRCKVMVDSFHANIEERNIFEACTSVGDLAAHVHVSENDRGVPGAGHVEWQELFGALKKIGYDRWLVIESFSSTVPEIANAASIWRAVSPSNEIVAVEGLAFVKDSWAKAQG